MGTCLALRLLAVGLVTLNVFVLSDFVRLTSRFHELFLTFHTLVVGSMIASAKVNWKRSPQSITSANIQI